MNRESRRLSPILRLLLCLLILALGAAGMLALKGLRQKPAQKQVAEHPLPVRAVEAKPVDVQVTLTGYGELVSRTTVTLSAEVRGRIVESADNLEPGRLVHHGELLYVIDDRDYRLARDIADRRLQALARERDLARAEFKRIDRLFQQKKVGSLSAVEKAESAVNALDSQIELIRKNREQALLNLQRCRIRSPFAGRLTKVEVEKNEYVTPGTPLLSLTDDSALEVVVSLDSRDGARWLRLGSGKPDTGHWFPAPEPVTCAVTWSENEQVRGRGRLDRIVTFDAATRMLKVAVRLLPGNRSLPPLVPGMFCRVEIPGRNLRNIYTLPREALSFTSTVYVVSNDRLYSRPVRVIREEKDRVLIDQGLNPGDLVITTRLQDPLEGTLVHVITAEEP